MKNPIPIILLSFLLSGISNAQNWQISVVKTEINISESSVNFSFDIPFEFTQLTSSADTLYFDLVTIFKGNAKEGKDYRIPQKTYYLVPDSNTIKQKRTSTISLEILKDDTTETEETALLGFLLHNSKQVKTDGSQFNFKLKINSQVEDHKFDPERPFRVAIGSNFDLLDGLKAGDLYTDVTFWHPGLIKRNSPKNFKEFQYFGIEAGFYQNRSGTIDSLRENYPRNKNLDLITIQGDSTKAIFTQFGDRIEYQYENLGLYINPSITKMYNLNNDLKEELILGLGLYFEVVKRNRITTYTQGRTISSDTTFIVGNQALVDTLQIFFPNEDYKNRNYGRTSYDRFYGLSLPVFYENRFAEFYFNWASGWGVFNSQIPFGQQTVGILGKPIFNNMYYITKFRIVEKKIGVQLAGEFRGFYSHDYNNIISISLSKMFDLTKVLSNAN